MRCWLRRSRTRHQGYWKPTFIVILRLHPLMSPSRSEESANVGLMSKKSVTRSAKSVAASAMVSVTVLTVSTTALVEVLTTFTTFFALTFQEFLVLVCRHPQAGHRHPRAGPHSRS